jgi:hypothetical protein
MNVILYLGIGSKSVQEKVQLLIKSQKVDEAEAAGLVQSCLLLPGSIKRVKKGLDKEGQEFKRKV